MKGREAEEEEGPWAAEQQLHKLLATEDGFHIGGQQEREGGPAMNYSLNENTPLYIYSMHGHGEGCEFIEKHLQEKHVQFTEEHESLPGRIPRAHI